MTIPDGDAQTLLKETLTIDKVANVRIPLTGEQQKQLDNTVGGEYARLQMFAQAFRKMRNAIEAEGGKIAFALVLVDREEGGRAAIEARGIPVLALYSRSTLLD
jgi:hypothetical protein